MNGRMKEKNKSRREGKRLMSTEGEMDEGWRKYRARKSRSSDGMKNGEGKN